MRTGPRSRTYRQQRLNPINDYILNILNSHQAYSLLLVFSLAFLEACPGIGILVSGAILLSTCTLLYHQAMADLPGILGSAFAGALLADHFSFHIGHHFGGSFHETKFAKKHIKIITNTENFILRFGPPGIIFGRLIPAIRSFVPLLYGISGLSPLKFSCYDLLACIIWCAGLASLILGLNSIFG